MSTRAKMPSISEDETAAVQQQHHHLLAGLSQLSCSTGNNEGFTLNRTDEEKSETRKSEAPLRRLRLDALAGRTNDPR
ncbi:unnamed protein product, partial [Mesorhabditis spiculigera]